jgi:hypothetical protein
METEFRYGRQLQRRVLMKRAALLTSLVVSLVLLGCEKPSQPPAAGAATAKQGTTGTLELGGIALGRPLDSSPLGERLKKSNPIIGPHAEKIGGSPILFSRVQLDASNNVEILYLKFDEEDYAAVKRALSEKYPMECKSGKVRDNRGREVDDELCVHTGSGGSLALRRRDQRSDTSSAGIISEALGKPELEGLFTDQDKHHKGT